MLYGNENQRLNLSTSSQQKLQHFTGQKRNIGMNIEDFSFHHSLSFVEIFVESM